MLFNDFGFIFLFLPLVLAGFFIPALRRWRVGFLFAASIIFYSVSGWDHATILALEILLIYALTTPGRDMAAWRLTLAVTIPALILVYFKYSAFIVAQFTGSLLTVNGDAEVFSLFQDILLPAGISFFTFQLISFAFDRKSGVIAEQPTLMNLALYISFSPQLVAGPILRYDQVRDAIEQLATFRPKYEDISQACIFIVYGLAAKVLLADGLGTVLGPLIADPTALRWDASIYVVLGYSFQIYFDFYGYSLIAIGLGRLFGFHLPDNFKHPYSTNNPRDFWRCWHVSLSYWLRDYLYLKIGGNKSYVRNIIIVFAICGLWHGAGWTFIIWGLYHAALVTGYHFAAPVWDRMHVVVQRVMTFVLVSLGWLLFVFDFENLHAFITSIANGGKNTIGVGAIWPWAILTFATLVCFYFSFENSALRRDRSNWQSFAVSIMLGVLAILIVLFIDQSNTFIYFRF